MGTPVTLRVDPNGFYLYWVDQNHEMDLLDIAIIRDTRTSRHAKIPKVSFHDILAFKINNTFVHSLNNELKFLRNAR